MSIHLRYRGDFICAFMGALVCSNLRNFCASVTRLSAQPNAHSALIDRQCQVTAVKQAACSKATEKH